MHRVEIKGRVYTLSAQELARVQAKGIKVTFILTF